MFIGFGGKLLGGGAGGQPAPHGKRRYRRAAVHGGQRIVVLQDRAEAIFAQFGIDACHAELLPGDKAEIIERPREDRARLAFIGDGIMMCPRWHRPVWASP